jgi:hypothetical protein
MGPMPSDLGGAASVALARIGDALGLYKTLHQRGPMTAASLLAQPVLTSATCANGCRIRRLQTTSPTIRRHRDSLCRWSKPRSSR